jgi:hypothetical protein
MSTVAFVFSLFGLMAYLEVSSLKKRIKDLEQQLSKIEGTPLHQEYQSLAKIASSYIGKSVTIGFKEDEGDADIFAYGNTKYGNNILLDSDNDWLLVKTESAKGTVTKLIRLSSITSIAEKK